MLNSLSYGDVRTNMSPKKKNQKNLMPKLQRLEIVPMSNLVLKKKSDDVVSPTDLTPMNKDTNKGTVKPMDVDENNLLAPTPWEEIRTYPKRIWQKSRPN